MRSWLTYFEIVDATVARVRVPSDEAIAYELDDRAARTWCAERAMTGAYIAHVFRGACEGVRSVEARA